MSEIIVIIDDEPEDIKNFKDHIKEWPSKYVVECEYDFGETIHKIDEIRSKGDKVVAVFVDICEKKGKDLTLPGLDTISSIKEKYKDIFVVAYTHYGVERINQAYSNGADWSWNKGEIKDLKYEDLNSHIEKHAMPYKKFSGIVLLKEVLSNFSNAIIKITKERRKEHSPFIINDEYDVQDILYTILKSIFIDLKEEDFSPKVGGKGTRIDFTIPSEKIVIETKMIKKSDTNEHKCIAELKEDYESYYKYPDIEYLVCLIYDPLNKTNDVNNFYELNGQRTREGKHYEVINIVQH